MPSSYALGAHFEQFIKDQVASGRYNNASEVVRDGLRLLEERKQDREAVLEELRNSIRRAQDSGVRLTADEVFGPLKARLKSQIDNEG